MKSFEYGSCFRVSKKKYSELVKQGKHPVLIQGKVKVKGITGKDKLVSHVWVKVGNKIIDPTKNQFDKYGGIIKYLPKDVFKNKKDI
jgi:hypothetical protein